MVLAVRTDEPARAPTSIAAVQDASQRLRLRGLDPPDVEALARTLFGDVPNLARLSAWMQSIAGGSPLLCTELARHWVDRGQVRYLEGIWVIPDELRSDDTPQSLVEAMDVRVLGLSPEARALGQALSVHGGTIPLELAVQLADNSGEDEVFAAVDELMREEIVVGSRAACRFRHDGLREALLRSIPAEARRVLHLRVGRALMSGGAIEPDAEAEVGWHLLHGGDDERGGRLLESAGRRLYFAQSFHDAVEPLQAALRIREKRPDSLAAQVELRFMLVCAGFLCSRELTLRYADATLRALRRYAGISAAERLAPFVGKHLAFFAGFSWATLQWSSTLTFARRPNPASGASNVSDCRRVHRRRCACVVRLADAEPAGPADGTCRDREERAGAERSLHPDLEPSRRLAGALRVRFHRVPRRAPRAPRKIGCCRRTRAGFRKAARSSFWRSRT